MQEVCDDYSLLVKSVWNSNGKDVYNPLYLLSHAAPIHSLFLYIMHEWVWRLYEHVTTVTAIFTIPVSPRARPKLQLHVYSCRCVVHARCLSWFLVFLWLRVTFKRYSFVKRMKHIWPIAIRDSLIRRRILPSCRGATKSRSSFNEALLICQHVRHSLVCRDSSSALKPLFPIYSSMLPLRSVSNKTKQKRGRVLPTLREIQHNKFAWQIAASPTSNISFFLLFGRYFYRPTKNKKKYENNKSCTRNELKR